jgi:hypothetical protein
MRRGARLHSAASPSLSGGVPSGAFSRHRGGVRVQPAEAVPDGGRVAAGALLGGEREGGASAG